MAYTSFGEKFSVRLFYQSLKYCAEVVIQVMSLTSILFSILVNQCL